MVRITIDTAQDDASTIRSVITILNQELSKQGTSHQHAPPQAQSPAPASSDNDSSLAGGAFQHQDMSNLMNMFSEDMPSTNPDAINKHNTASDPSSRRSQPDSDDGFLFGSVEDLASKRQRSPKRPDDDDTSEDGFSVSEYH